MPARAGAPDFGAGGPRFSAPSRGTVPPRISNGTSNKAEHQSALRAAIQKATNGRETPANSFSAKSPAEIMRELMSPPRNENAETPEQKSPRGARAGQPEEKLQTSVPRGGESEVSTDVLREILNGKERSDKK